MDEQFLQAHALRMQAKKAEVQAAIGQAQQERGVLLLLTGDGRLQGVLGHGHRAVEHPEATGVEPRQETSHQRGLSRAKVAIERNKRRHGQCVDEPTPE